VTGSGGNDTMIAPAEVDVVVSGVFTVVVGFVFNGILVVVGSGGKVHGFPGLAVVVGVTVVA